MSLPHDGTQSVHACFLGMKKPSLPPQGSFFQRGGGVSNKNLLIVNGRVSVSPATRF